MKYLLIILILLGIWVLFKKILPRFKTPKVGAMCLVTGAVKSGKTTFSFNLAYQNYKKRHRSWKFRRVLAKIFKKPIPEEPLFYTNVPVTIPHVLITDDLLTRKKRFRYGSVVYVDEASLVADSQLFKDQDLNERLLLFNKLIGHETRGGMLVYDTQSFEDLHYSIKRCVSQVFYVHHITKWIPFFGISYVRELYVDPSTNTYNVVTKDVEADLLPVWFLKSIWNKFDTYAFSSFTDSLPVEDKIVDSCENLKVTNLVTFRNYKSIKEEKHESTEKQDA